ncbi:MAG: hypothetical protein QW320_05060 [Ignisphaera sp.]
MPAKKNSKPTRKKLAEESKETSQTMIHKGIYKEIAKKLQARFDHARIEFEGKSILHSGSVCFDLFMETQEPLTGQMINEIKDVAHEFNHMLIDIMVWCENGKINMSFWLMPETEAKQLKISEI